MAKVNLLAIISGKLKKNLLLALLILNKILKFALFKGPPHPHPKKKSKSCRENN
jgi:hypothetical protein